MEDLTLSRFILEPAERVLNCMLRFSLTKCTDDRDMVFAFLSFSGIPALMAANYRLTVNDLYTTFASKLIECGAVNSLLAIASSQATWKHRDQGLPSWVPDLRCGMKGISKYQYKMRGSLDVKSNDRSKARARVVDGNELEFTARIGRVDSLPDEWRDFETARALHGVTTYDYLCDAGLNQWDDKRLYFIITHGRRIGRQFSASPRVWACCSKIEVRTLRLY